MRSVLFRCCLFMLCLLLCYGKFLNIVICWWNFFFTFDVVGKILSISHAYMHVGTSGNGNVCLGLPQSIYAVTMRGTGPPPSVSLTYELKLKKRTYNKYQDRNKQLPKEWNSCFLFIIRINQLILVLYRSFLLTLHQRHTHTHTKKNCSINNGQISIYTLHTAKKQHHTHLKM